MGKPKNKTIRSFGSSFRYDFNAEDWSNLLFFAQKYGWTPEKGMSLWYHASKVEFSPDDARSFSAALKSILAALAEDPRQVRHPAMDGTILYPSGELVYLFSELGDYGGFEVSNLTGAD